jgi:hypothetical protein
VWWVQKDAPRSFVEREVCVVFEKAVCARYESGLVRLEMDGVGGSKRTLRARLESGRVCVGFEIAVCACQESGVVRLVMDGVDGSKRTLRARLESGRVSVVFEKAVCAR